MTSNRLHYGRPLKVSIERDALVIRCGVQTLAHAVRYADWANQFDDEASDYIRTFAILREREFAEDVIRAMQAEREDGSSLLSGFLDKAAKDAVEDGSMACEYGQRIKQLETSPLETWAAPSDGDQ